MPSDMRAHGTFAWNELLTRDPERAKAFFAATLGWTFDALLGWMQGL